MMAKKPSRAISQYQKVTPIPPQSIKKKKITTHLEDRKTTRSLKNLAITKPFPSEQTEETLRETERFLNDVFASIQDGISILDKDMNIIGVNQTMERWYSHAMPLVGKKCYETYHGRKERCDICPTHQTILTGKGAYEVVPKVEPDGKIVGWLDLYSFPLIDTATGKMSGVIEYVRDITERKRAEEALRENEKRFKELFDEAPVGYYEVDTNGCITHVNRTELEMLGYTAQEMIGQPIWHFLEEKETGREKLTAKLAGDLPPAKGIERTCIHKDGSRIPVIIEERILNDREGRIVGLRSTMQNHTEFKRAEEALRKSEERYRTILENIEDGYYEVDLAGNFTFFNDSLYRIHGYPKEELMGMNTRQYTDKETAKRVYQAFNKLYRTGEPGRIFDYEITRKDGTKAIIELSASLMRNPEGKPIGFRGITRDVTEHIRTEEALRKSEERYRNILENIEDGYYEVDLAGNFTFFNDSQCRIHGYPKEELMGMNTRQYTDKETAKAVYQAFNKIYRTGEPGRIFAVEVIRKDGTKAITELSASLIRNPEGKPIGFRGMIRDVTERIRAEEALRKSEERYRTILEKIEDGYYEVDLAGNFTFLNNSMCRIHGYPKEELMGMNTRQYTDKETAKRVYQAFNKIYRTGEPGVTLTHEIIRKDGTKAVTETSASLIRNPEGKPIGFRGITRDVTEHIRTEEALRKSEERYRNILENIEDGYYEVDLAGNFTFFNDSMCRIHGYPKEELMGMNTRQYTDKETAKRIYQAFNKIYRTGEPGRTFATEIIRKDGTKVITELSASLIRNSEGKPIGFRGITRDVTERKKMEEALHEREERYRTLLETMEEGYYEVDLKGRFTFFNEALRKVHASSKEEMLGMSNRQYMDEATAQKVYKVFNQVYRTGQPGEVAEWEITRGDSKKAILESSVYLIRNAKGEPIGFRGITRNITGRKRTEEALRQSEERYRTIIENIQDGYFEVDLAGNFTFVNDAERANLGYSREELIGMNNRQYTDEKTARELYHLFNRIYRTGQPIKGYDLEIIKKDGSKGFDELSVSLIRDPEGKPIGFRGISRDITERKQAEEEKLSLQEQLRQSQKMEAIGQLAGGVAHDFNNLLTVIKGYSQISLLDLKENDPLRGNIQEIEKATQRATDLTRQLLAFSRRQILDFKVVDLNALLKDLEKMLRRIIGEDIELATLLAEDLGRVKIDSSQIEQVIFNLAVNARDAMPSGGKLTIETVNVELDEVYAHAHVGVIPGRYVSLSVSDTGVGMSQEVKEKVFEPFFTTKGKGKGTGLGLSMVYGIVKQSNGNIWVYSEPEHGTTFKIHLPRIEEALDTLRGRDETDFFPRGSETILLVEDDELLRDLAYRLLRQQGYRVWEAANGEEALRVVQEHDGERIHLLLADIVMPQMGGKELADQLKILRPDVKVLYTSGYAHDAIVHHGVLDPGTHFLQKPFSLKTLSNKVREVLDG